MKNILVLVVLLMYLYGCNEGEDNQVNSKPAIKATINLTSLPQSFTYDLDNSQNGTQEYAWRISFDINNDLMINEGDIYFQISLVASDSTPQQTINRDQLKAYIWEYNDGTSYIATRDVEIKLESTDKSFTFIAPLNLHKSLSSISNGTQVYVETLYRDKNSGTYYYDYYPSKQNYTVGMDTGVLTDDILDFETNIGPVSGVDYPLIDIESISVSVE